MWCRGVLIGGVTLALTACGPMPGYVPKSERQAERQPERQPERQADRSTADDEPESSPGVEYEDREDAPVATADPTPRDAPRRYRPPTVLDRGAAPAPAADPAEDEPGATPETPRVEVVELGRADTYYLIDRERRMCFFIHKETSARVDCASIPEGRDVQPREGDEPPPAIIPAPSAPSAPPAPPSEGVTRRYVEPTPPAPKPAAPQPQPASDDSPTADELARFEAAFGQIACDRRQESLVPPRTRVEAQGLTLARYSAIEAWATADERGWRMLVSRAYRECGSRD